MQYGHNTRKEGEGREGWWEGRGEREGEGEGREGGGGIADHRDTL